MREEEERIEIERKEREAHGKTQNPKKAIMCFNICENGVQTKRNKERILEEIHMKALHRN